MEKLAFVDCTTKLLDKIFGLRRQSRFDSLDEWMKASKSIVLSKKDK